MDIALRTDDLIREIFTSFRGCARTDMAALYNAALTCKRFSFHALDALWFSLFNLGPLTALIPNSKEAENGTVYMTKPLSKGDLTTFDRYAKRIKEYHSCGYETSTRYWIPVILDLLECLNRRDLLPNLRYLHVTFLATRPESLDLTPFLLCPNLRYLTVEFRDMQQIASSFPRIVRLAPRLRCLRIPDQSIPEDLLPLLSNFRSLQELSTRNDFVISSKTFSSAFPFADQLKTWCLASLTVDLGDLSQAPAVGPSFPQFPVLVELVFFAPISIGAIAEAFRRNIFPHIEGLTIYVSPSTNGRNGGWSKLFSTLFSAKNCIQSIAIFPSSDGLDLDDDDDIFAPLDNSRPQSLKELTLLAPLQKSLPASSIRILVDVFPHLTHLRISAVEISFAHLALLAQGLPHLRDLEIGVNGNTVPQPDTLPLLSHRLKVIKLGDSDVGHPAQFARCLDRLFPFVRVSDIFRPPKTDEMALILAYMQSCRQDQEARIDQHAEES